MKKMMLPFLFLIIFLNSCSRLDVAVQFASTYVANKADDYFDTNKEQAKWLKDNFNKDFVKVQKIIFPQMAAELMKAADVVSSKRTIDTMMLQASYDRVKNLFYDVLRTFSAKAVLFADQLTSKQIVYFQKTFDKKMNDLKEDESSKDSYKKMKKQFDTWMGTMTTVQKNELEKFTKANPPLTAEKIYTRQLLAHEFVTAYPDKISRKRFVEKITTHFDDAYENRFSKTAKERNNKVVALVASILNKMTDDQRETLVETLRDRANQLVKISKN
ncbi:MAG: hypothetical protein H7177_01140 [Rhizobacter sp.]|nr:hypothetical protein [Bacteriovorax sp.]